MWEIKSWDIANFSFANQFSLGVILNELEKSQKLVSIKIWYCKKYTCKLTIYNCNSKKDLVAFTI